MTSRSSVILATVAVGTTAWIVYDHIQRRRRAARRGSHHGNDGAAHEKAPRRLLPPRELYERDVDVTSCAGGAPPVREVLAQTTEVPMSLAENGRRKDARRILERGTVSIVHGSVTGTCRTFANELGRTLTEKLAKNRVHVQVAAAQDFDWWDELVNDDGESDDVDNDARAVTKKDCPTAMLILIVSTYTNGTWPPAAENLSASLRELLNDWRIAKFPLRKKLQVAVFGMGSSEYTVDDGEPGGASNMGQPAKEAVSLFQQLGARCVVPLRIGDDAVADHARQSFDSWSAALVKWFAASAPAKPEANGARDACCHGNTSNSDCCQVNNESHGCQDEKGASSAISNSGDRDVDTDSDGDDEDEVEPEVMDLEDMGDAMLASQSSNGNESSAPREMVTPSQAKALKKEGYRLIGTHSAVKLCRWTKHQLRGRGGCYKHTFYGITSYQCMEATPSLACANKCVFCWRHHKNPVGKEWRWKTDDPHYIVDQAVQTHIQMIKETKGIPGVQMDRWREAHTVRHCALSLVGEPIMYPRIDELLADLHGRRISTFLVTNGQHPSAIASLRPITQLYVSVDAPSKESLIAIDRPLFSDAWERLRESLSSLKDKGQRTVARLTVVKGWNSDELEGYAQLIALGRVSLVEVKGVTFCGKSDASNLNMTNTPWHHEVVELTRTLKREIDKLRLSGGDGAEGTDAPPEYDIACEHKHSCSVLLARVDQFAVTDPASGKRTWRTWIDYDKFHELAARHARDPSFAFTVQDYTSETPEWALFGSNEEGFDPTDRRHRRKSKHPMYTQFDPQGVPTHDHGDAPLSDAERNRLKTLMDERRAQIGSGSVVTESRDGAKEVLDASLMFRGLVVVK